jgi:hypothetical protein
MANHYLIEANEKPLVKSTLDELMKFSGYTVDMILQYVPDDDHYLIFARYNQNKIIRQVFTQRNAPRTYRNVQRAVEWGKSIGFSSVNIHIDYSTFPEKDEGC